MLFKQRNTKRTILAVLGLAFLYAGCGPLPEDVGSEGYGIVDVPHTAVERQSIGNCWLYAQASWVESIHLSNLLANNGSGGGDTTETLLSKEDESVAEDETKTYSVTVPADARRLVAELTPASGDPDLKINYDGTECYPYTTGDEKCVFDAPSAGEMTVEVIGYSAAEYSLVLVVEKSGGGESPEELDVSQSYWTYWHWFDQVTGYMYDDEISTGGNQWKSHALVRDRGYMLEVDFVPEDAEKEMSNRQSSAKSKINAALAEGGELATSEARKDGKLVRRVFDDAWGLSQDVRAQLDQVFGEDGKTTLRYGGDVTGTKIVDPNSVMVRYSKLSSSNNTTFVQGTLVDAVKSWDNARYPSSSSQRRKFLQRVQRALHDRQPVVITWDVDFNALENYDEERGGSFNMQTLKDAGGPGRQGGHMTVLEDYAAITVEYGLIEAAKTLDPAVPEDAAKLEALLLPSTEITLLRTKNSWGANRPDRQFAKGFPGYHDLWMDYLNGPIKFCPSVDDKTDENCTGESTPLRTVMLPPGY